MADTQEREWTRWYDQRPPNERGSYCYRATFPFFGLTVTAEWTEEMSLCGMGYGDNEWWPRHLHHWDGYRRYITNPTLEWSPVQAYDADGIVWHGLDLLPCPFTGKPAKLDVQGLYIGAPLWHSEAVWISSPGVPRRRWTDAKAMQKAWNTRADAASPTLLDALEGVIAELEEMYRATAGRRWPLRQHEGECDSMTQALTIQELNALWPSDSWSIGRTGAEDGTHHYTAYVHGHSACESGSGKTPREAMEKAIAKFRERLRRTRQEAEQLERELSEQAA